MIVKLVLLPFRVALAVGCVLVILAAAPVIVLLANRRPGDDR